MNPMNPAKPVDASALVTKQTRLIHRQRVTVLLLFLSLISTMLYASAERRRADLWRADALQTRSLLNSGQAVPTTEVDLPLLARDQARYPATLIGEDGARTPLTGKALHIDLGGERLLEVDLTRRDKGWLYMWSPARREDTHFNRVVFHPHCSNSYSLELDRVALRSASVASVEAGDSVRYQPSR